MFGAAFQYESLPSELRAFLSLWSLVWGNPSFSSKFPHGPPSSTYKEKDLKSIPTEVLTLRSIKCNLLPQIFAFISQESIKLRRQFCALECQAVYVHVCIIVASFWFCPQSLPRTFAVTDWPATASGSSSCSASSQSGIAGKPNLVS